MKRIGLLSDTHGYWDGRYERYFQECDEIWHAGDIGSPELAGAFESLGKPFRAVYGNVDGQPIRQRFPRVLRFICEGASVMMTHIGGYPGHYDASIRAELYGNPPMIFISGHSHILKVQYDNQLNLLHINPGAAGLQGWQQVRTLVRFSIQDGKPQDLEVVEIPRY